MGVEEAVRRLRSAAMMLRAALLAGDSETKKLLQELAAKEIEEAVKILAVSENVPRPRRKRAEYRSTAANYIARLIDRARKEGVVLFEDGSARVIYLPSHDRVFFDGCFGSEITEYYASLKSSELIELINAVPEGADMGYASMILKDVARKMELRVIRAVQSHCARTLLAKIGSDRETKERVLTKLREASSGS